MNRVFSLAVLAFIVVIFPTSTDESPAHSRTNVVLILGDDMGYGDIGPYGVPDIKTPNLNRLAREGVRLTDAYAAAPVAAIQPD